MLKVPSPSKGLYKRPRSTKCLRRRPERSVNNVGAQVLETKSRYRIKIKPTVYERLQNNEAGSSLPFLVFRSFLNELGPTRSGFLEYLFDLLIGPASALFPHKNIEPRRT